MEKQAASGETGPGARDGEALVRLLFPDAQDVKTPEEYEAIYPPRTLPQGAMVTRFAPSPTGFMHIGGIFVSLINKRLSAQSGGVFFLRIEDTDQKRQIPGALETILDALARYDLTPDEGVFPKADGSQEERGGYGPYVQTKRASIYRDYAISLIRRGLAYPCWMTVEEIEAMRQKQLAENIKPGVHGRWAKWRDAPLAEVEAALKSGQPFVVRLKVTDDPAGRIEWKDLVKGVISMPVNDIDHVLLKSDGIPTYHFAHAVDDHLMRTTHVIRGDEWMSSIPLHLQLFRTLGFKPVHYAHVPPIQKLDHSEEVDETTGEKRTVESRRKLSKRKDAEANVEFYHEMGVPEVATIEYLLNIANSAFEDWRKKSPSAPYTDFPLKLNKLAAGGALSDMVKLKSISQGVVGRMRADVIYPQGLVWAKKYDPELAALMEKYPDYTKRAIDIERDTPKGNKRIVTWQDIRAQLTYFYDELYERIEKFEFPEAMPVEERSSLIKKLADVYDPADPKDVWLEKIRKVAVESGYAGEVKQYKASPESFKGHFGDVAMLERVAVCGTQQSPDLYEVLQVLGAERVRARLARFSA